MRIHAAHLGLGAVVYTEPIGPSAGVSIARAKEACTIATGRWDDAAGGCRLPEARPAPSWCDWVPFSGSLEACRVPSVQELESYGAYTAYKIAQKDKAGCPPTYKDGRMVPTAAGCETTGAEAAQQIMVVSNQSAVNSVDSAGCEYQAALNHPTLTQLFGPAVACGVTDPFDKDHYGWLIYVVLGVGALLAVSIFVGGRR